MRRRFTSDEEGHGDPPLHEDDKPEAHRWLVTLERTTVETVTVEVFAADDVRADALAHEMVEQYRTTWKELSKQVEMTNCEEL